MKIVSWNMQNKRDSWRFLVDRHQDSDFAFVQEACTPTRYVRKHAAHWDIPYERWQVKPKRYKQEVVRVAGGWNFDRLDRDMIGGLGAEGRALIKPRFRAAAVARRSGWPDIGLICVATGPKNSLKLADTVTAVRRTLRRTRFDPQMPLVVAGDLTTDIDRTPATFAAMEEIGLLRIGPDGPNFIQKSLGEVPQDAWRELNHVFASRELADRVSVDALNDPDENSGSFWGPSDHCRVAIEVQC